jgi:hypothetical protein
MQLTDDHEYDDEDFREGEACNLAGIISALAHHCGLPVGEVSLIEDDYGITSLSCDLLDTILQAHQADLDPRMAAAYVLVLAGCSIAHTPYAYEAAGIAGRLFASQCFTPSHEGGRCPESLWMLHLHRRTVTFVGAALTQINIISEALKMEGELDGDDLALLVQRVMWCSPRGEFQAIPLIRYTSAPAIETVEG